MSQKIDDMKTDHIPNKKKKMTVDQFVQQFNTLDPNNYGNWPISVKITCWLFIIAAICALSYFLMSKSKMGEIESAQAQEQNLLNEFREKDSKLRNLQKLQEQLLQMEVDFTQQLEKLPKDTEIPGLVEDINVTGVSSGLKFQKIVLENEVKQEFFIEQPITIIATGDYHSFGNFVSGTAALPRIVTLHDFTIEGKQDANKKVDVPTVTYTVHAKTYRYVGEADQVLSATGTDTASASTTAQTQGATPK